MKKIANTVLAAGWLAIASSSFATLATFNNGENQGTVRGKINASILQTNTNTTDIATNTAAIAINTPLAAGAVQNGTNSDVNLYLDSGEWYMESGTVTFDLLPGESFDVNGPMQVYDDPDGSSGVGNRGYNDGRYLQLSGTNDVIDAAVEQAGSGNLSSNDVGTAAYLDAGTNDTDVVQYQDLVGWAIDPYAIPKLYFDQELTRWATATNSAFTNGVWTITPDWVHASNPDSAAGYFSTESALEPEYFTNTVLWLNPITPAINVGASNAFEMVDCSATQSNASLYTVATYRQPGREFSGGRWWYTFDGEKLVSSNDYVNALGRSGAVDKVIYYKGEFPDYTDPQNGTNSLCVAGSASATVNSGDNVLWVNYNGNMLLRSRCGNVAQDGYVQYAQGQTSDYNAKFDGGIHTIVVKLDSAGISTWIDGVNYHTDAALSGRGTNVCDLVGASTYGGITPSNPCNNVDMLEYFIIHAALSDAECLELSGR
jgi:hypothetical protein